MGDFLYKNWIYFMVFTVMAVGLIVGFIAGGDDGYDKGYEMASAEGDLKVKEAIRKTAAFFDTSDDIPGKSYTYEKLYTADEMGQLLMEALIEEVDSANFTIEYDGNDAKWHLSMSHGMVK
jgi:hypothetical protein